VDVEDGEKDADLLAAAVREIALLDLFDCDDFAIGRGDDLAFGGRDFTLGIAKKIQAEKGCDEAECEDRRMCQRAYDRERRARSYY
jgi:hypothetical protein